MKDNLTHISAILDRSGSMETIAAKTIEGFNGFVVDQQKAPGDATLSLFLFDDKFDTVHDFLDIQSVPKLTSELYFARGMTAQYDAMAKSIQLTGEKLAAMPEEERPSKVIVLVMTDGAENSSREFPGEQGRLALKAMIEHQTQKYNWDFVFMGANIDAKTTATSLGISAANSAQYDADDAGTSRAYTSMSKGMTRARTVMGHPGVSPAAGFFDEDE